MARINIEDDLYKDKRFVNLILKLQSMDAALGALVRAWSLAQKWYLTDDRMIPVNEWKEQEISDSVIEVGLATVINGKVKVVGDDEQFSWLVQKQEAGKKSANSRANKKSTSVESRSTPVNGREPPSPTLPLSHNTTKATENYNAQFHPSVPDFKEFLKRNGLSPFLKNQIPIIVAQFEKLEVFEEFINSVAKSAEGNKLSGMDLTRYVCAAVKREIGTKT